MSPFDTLMQISMGFTLPRALHVIAELGIADVLDDRPQPVAELASASGVDASALHRTLRVLAAHGVFQRNGTVYGHTEASRLLRSNHPQSMRSFVRMQGIPALWRIWEHFDHSLQTGRSAAERALPNGGFWGYFAENPEHSRLFNDAMTSKTHGQTAGILAKYDFSRFASVADIGGGNGHFLRAMLAVTPNTRGVLFDLPHVIDQASAAASGRLELRAGDFFKDALPVCDAYLMMQVLHDWSDEECAEILQAVRRSAPPHAKLLLAEFALPDDNSPSWTLFIDLIMLGELTGKERTAAEFAELLRLSGFRLDHVIDVGLNTSLLEASVR